MLGGKVLQVLVQRVLNAQGPRAVRRAAAQHVAGSARLVAAGVTKLVAAGVTKPTQHFSPSPACAPLTCGVPGAHVDELGARKRQLRAANARSPNTEPPTQSPQHGPCNTHSSLR
eukprot:365264-Chlamydomonas_euryale.AAC.5